MESISDLFLFTKESKSKQRNRKSNALINLNILVKKTMKKSNLVVLISINHNLIRLKFIFDAKYKKQMKKKKKKSMLEGKVYGKVKKG